MDGTSPEPVRQNWKYERRTIKCHKCKKDVVVEGDTSSCFSGKLLCTACTRRD